MKKFAFLFDGLCSIGRLNLDGSHALAKKGGELVAYQERTG